MTRNVIYAIIGLCIIVVLIAGGIFAFHIIGSKTGIEYGTNILIKGDGATFPEPQIQAWINAYTSMKKNVKIEYAGVGSGQGQSDFINGIVDFAGSDPPLKSDKWSEAVKKYGKVYQFPIIAGAVAIAYNIPEIPDTYHLKLSSSVLVNVLLGKIVYWDDDRIKELNPDITDKLPHKEIIFVHRSDSSGTTQIFTTYLSLVSTEWKSTVGSGKLVEWPLDATGRGLGAKGNPGVASTLKSTPYSMGYVELAFTKGLGVVALENREGNFVIPTEESIKESLKQVSYVLPSPDKNWDEYNILEKILNPPGENSYPVIAFSHFIVKGANNYDENVAKALADFIEWVLTEGQKGEYIVEGYVALPPEIAQIGLKVAEELRGG